MIFSIKSNSPWQKLQVFCGVGDIQMAAILQPIVRERQTKVFGGRLRIIAQN